MSCGFTNTHALGECRCFKPRDLVVLLESQQLWQRLLLHMTRRRREHPESVADVMVTVMLRDRTRWLRN